LLWVNSILIVLAVGLLLPVLVLCAECLAALLPARRMRTASGKRPADLRVAVLIPAHNEEAVLATTLSGLTPQLREGDQIIVVADNCDDDTASIARSFGATALERTNPVHRGKGFALDHGLRHLQQHTPPDVLIMIDADCTVHEGAIDALVQQVAATGRPAQACYLMERPENPGPKDCVSALAFLVKNWVRPAGLVKLGLPCLLTGTGMAFPWSVIAKAKLASGNIVEDMQLGLDLALDGHAALFCGDAHVTGHLPKHQKIAYGQRTRWEHGHLQTLLSQAPRMFKAGLRRHRMQALGLATELAVPPLCLLMMVLIGAAGAATIAAATLGTTWLAAQLLGGGIAAIAMCLLLAWAKFGRKSLPLTALLAAPIYMAWKLPMYFAFLFKRHTEWNRTARVAPAGSLLTPALAGAGVDASAGFELELEPAGTHARRDFNRDLPIAQPATAAVAASLVVTPSQCVRHVLRQFEAGVGGIIVRPDAEHSEWCARDPEFARIMAAAELVVCESLPLAWANRLQGTPLPSRAAGADLCWQLIAAATRAGRSLFLLGDDVQITNEAAAIMQERFARLKLAGTYDAPNGFDSHHEAFQHVAHALERANPDLVVVALGTPKQERLIAKLRERLPRTWWLTVGKDFQCLCDGTGRLAVWSHDISYRDPVDLGRRYLIGGLPFAASSLLGGPSVKRLARVLSRSTRQERALREMLASGIDQLVVDDATVAGSTAPTTDDAPAAGRAIVYQSFLKGFLSEFGPDDDDDGGASIAGPRPSAPHDSLCRLRAVILLGGAVRPSRLSLTLGRSPLDLPLEDGRSILWHWRDHALELRDVVGLDELPVRVLVDQHSIHPAAPSRGSQVRVIIERDASPYRGTAGVLRDVTEVYGDDDFVLVATAAQALLTPLADLAAALANQSADVTLISHHDGSPSGLMLVRCGALRSIATVGYVDMKEQGLPQLTSRFDVRHLPRHSPTALPIRTLGEYVSAIQYRYRMRLGKPVSNDPFAEDCRESFAVVEDGALVHPSAKVHDSVILRGARVGPEALVVRSVIGPGTLVRQGEHIIDQLISGEASAVARPPALVAPSRHIGAMGPSLAMARLAVR
jgi:exopolysaccharide biosynthesis WecB/TagA/CpsF family protein